MGEFKALLDQIERVNVQHKQEPDVIDQCFARVFSTVEGKQALRYMCDLWLDTQLFVPGDPQHTAYNLGHADLVTFIKDCVKAAKG